MVKSFVSGAPNGVGTAVAGGKMVATPSQTFDDRASGEFDGRKRKSSRHLAKIRAAIQVLQDKSVHAERDGMAQIARADPDRKSKKATGIKGGKNVADVQERAVQDDVPSRPSTLSPSDSVIDRVFSVESGGKQWDCNIRKLNDLVIDIRGLRTLFNETYDLTMASNLEEEESLFFTIMDMVSEAICENICMWLCKQRKDQQCSSAQCLTANAESTPTDEPWQYESVHAADMESAEAEEKARRRLDTTELEKRIKCLERRVILEEIFAAARKLNIEQSVIDKKLLQWAKSLCLLDGRVCFIHKGSRYGPEALLSDWLEKHHGCTAWLQRNG